MDLTVNSLERCHAKEAKSFQYLCSSKTSFLLQGSNLFVKTKQIDGSRHAQDEMSNWETIVRDDGRDLLELLLLVDLLSPQN